MANMVHCYNKGCGKKFDLNDNSNGACQYHPGAPVFHDAKKSWSCCNKGSTDFSVFLGLPGCAKGQHNPVKPVEKEERQQLDPKYNTDVVVVEAPKPPVVKLERPEKDSISLTRLKYTSAPSLAATLEQKKAQLAEKVVASAMEGDVTVGTKCKNQGCSMMYEGPQSNTEICYHHTGIPVFHEGMKYWSCCDRKTSDFDAFLSQVGCASGKHLWRKQAVVSSCRVDWHQTGSHVCISIFAKAPVPDTSLIVANPVLLRVSLDYEAGEAHFEKEFHLFGIVDVEASNVRFMGTKVEINLKKAEPESWPFLEVKS